MMTETCCMDTTSRRTETETNNNNNNNNRLVSMRDVVVNDRLIT